MAHPQEHPVEKLLATAQESARTMWRAYDLCLAHPDRSPEWEKEAHVFFEKVMAADARVWRIQAQRDILHGAPGEEPKPGDLLAKLEKAISALHGCPCFHEGGFFVDEAFDDRRRWTGVVEIFALRNHPAATHAFAWAWDDRGELRYHVHLRVSPIDSPRDAVLSAVAETPHGGSIPHGLIR